MAGFLSTAVWSRIFLYPQPMNSAQILCWHPALPKSVHATDVNNVVDVVLQSITVMMANAAVHELETADVVFEPNIGDIGTMDFSQTKRSLQQGVKTGRAQLYLVYEAIERYYRTRGGLVPDELEAIRHIAQRHRKQASALD